MSGAVLSTQHVFVNTQHCDGDPYSFDVRLPAQALTCDFATQSLRLRLQNFSLYHNWYNVSDQFNTLTVSNAVTQQAFTRSIAPGNYTYVDLARTVTALFALLELPNFQCRYLRSQNKMRFTCDVAFQLTFVDGVYRALGFAQSEVSVISAAMDGGLHSVTSSRVLRPLDSSEFVLQVVNLTPLSANYNTTPEGVQVSNFLAAVSFDSRPFTTFSWRNDNDLFPMTIAQTTLNSLQMLVTDFDGNPLTFLPDFTFCLAVDVLAAPQQQGGADGTLAVLNQIADTLKNIFMVSMLGADKARAELEDAMQA